MQTWKDVEKAFVDSFSRFGKSAAVFRLPDTAMVKATAGPKAFLPDQPSDYVVVLDGDMFFAEVKSTQDAEAFHFSNLRKGQVNASRRAVSAGGKYLIFIYSFALSQWFCVPAQIIHHTSLVLKKKHLKWSELEPYQYEL